MAKLTELQKVVIAGCVLLGVEDWKKVFLYLNPERAEAISAGSLAVGATRLKQNTDIQKLILSYKKRLFELSEITRGEEESNKSVTLEGGAGSVSGGNEFDFTDPNELIRYANIQANRLKDEKDRQAYLKIISDHLHFKDNNDAGNIEIQRFYRPLLCDSCPLYKAKK